MRIKHSLLTCGCLMVPLAGTKSGVRKMPPRAEGHGFIVISGRPQDESKLPLLRDLSNSSHIPKAEKTVKRYLNMVVFEP